MNGRAELPEIIAVLLEQDGYFCVHTIWESSFCVTFSCRVLLQELRKD